MKPGMQLAKERPTIDYTSSCLLTAGRQVGYMAVLKCGRVLIFATGYGQPGWTLGVDKTWPVTAKLISWSITAETDWQTLPAWVVTAGRNGTVIHSPLTHGRFGWVVNFTCGVWTGQKIYIALYVD
jgi:hypothetical protein